MVAEPLSIALIAVFPDLAEDALRYGVTGRAREQGLWRFHGFSLRDFATDSRHSIDARPVAGGPGMVLLPSLLDAALSVAKAWHGRDSRVLLLSPDGAPLQQDRVREFSVQNQCLTLIAGRYEGVDQRWVDANVDATVSLGDYVLSGGELAAAVLVDACVRLIPGALGDADSIEFESFSSNRLDWPHFALAPELATTIPAALSSGDHARITKWRTCQSLLRTWRRRPDLLARSSLSAEEENTIIKELQYNQ